jgi:hypothetical protein
MNEKKVILTAEELMMVGKERYYTTISNKRKWAEFILGITVIITFLFLMLWINLPKDNLIPQEYKNSDGVIVEFMDSDYGVVLDGKLYEPLPSSNVSMSPALLVDSIVFIISMFAFLIIWGIESIARKKFARKMCADAGMLVVIAKSNTE